MGPSGDLNDVKKSLCPIGIGTPDSSVVYPVRSCCTDCAIPPPSVCLVWGLRMRKHNGLNLTDTKRCRRVSVIRYIELLKLLRGRNVKEF
jgi:hypothetical protein